MRDYKKEIETRVAFIKDLLNTSHTNGIIFGNSGGKDSCLVGILCKMASENTVGVIMPCMSKINFNQDMEDGKKMAEKYMIETITIDLSMAKEKILENTEDYNLSKMSIANISPRLRMITLYALAQTRNYLVAGTGNKCERYMGYFTKWGDGACDFNPIADLTVSEVYEFLRYLDAPITIIEKEPSAGLFEGQTDEKEMGVTYLEIEKFLNGEKIDENSEKIIKSYHQRSEHKRTMPKLFIEE